MEEEDEDEVFSRRALDRVARGVARGERDAFRRDGENAGLMPFLHVNQRSKMQKFLAWLVSLRTAVRRWRNYSGLCKGVKR